jgi:peptidoglycan-N-acetylglucosamine deacetylase
MDRRCLLVIALFALAGLAGAGFAVHESGGGGARAARQRAAVAAVHRASATPLARRVARADARVVAAALRHVSVIRQGTRRRREIALTFDDGPSAYTHRVVSTLRRLHVPGTFFTVGIHLNRYPAAIASELHAGFSVEDHTVNHPALAPMPAAGQRREIRGNARRLTRLGAPWPRLFRPPYGSYDRTTEAITRSLGMLVVLWTVDTEDYLRPGRKRIVAKAVSGARPGAIILLHDGGGDRSQTVAALPAIVRILRHRGYRLVTVPQLLRPLGTPVGRGWMFGA